jgi:hypothetical protein
MSSGFWKKSNEPGIFGGGHKKGLWSSGQDTASPGHDGLESTAKDGGMEWNELEKEYYKDFDRRIANQVDHKYKYEDQHAGKNQAENSTRSDKDTKDQETPVDNTGTGGAPYREEAMKVTDIRRGGHKRLTDLISTRFSKRLINRPLSDFSRGSKPLPETNPVDCPESGCQVCFGTCCQCEQFGIWHEKDEGPRCYHEYKDLESRGHYDGTWEDHPENYTREEWQRYQEEKRNIERINKEMEKDREEMKKLAKEHEKTRFTLRDYLKLNYGDIDIDAEEEMDMDEDDFDGDNDQDYNGNYDNDDEEDLY